MQPHSALLSICPGNLLPLPGQWGPQPWGPQSHQRGMHKAWGGPRQQRTPARLSLNSAVLTSLADSQQAQSRLRTPDSFQCTTALLPPCPWLNGFTDNPSLHRALPPQRVKPARGAAGSHGCPAVATATGGSPPLPLVEGDFPLVAAASNKWSRSTQPTSQPASSGCRDRVARGGARATADSSRPVLCKTQSQAAAGRGEAGMAPRRVTQCPKLWQTGQGGSEQGLLLDPRLKQQPGDGGQHPPSSLCPGCSFQGC